MKRRIFLVENQEQRIAPIIEAFEKLANVWDVQHFKAGKEALAALQEQQVHAVVAQYRLPDIDGGELLNTVSEQFPSVKRFLMADPGDSTARAETFDQFHQFVANDVEPVALATVIRSAFNLDTRLKNKQLTMLLSGNVRLPSVPSTYFELIKALESPDVPMSDAMDIIVKDIAVTTKLLKVANSAFYGLSEKTSDPGKAVSMIGLERLKGIVLGIQVFGQYERDKDMAKSATALWEHSLRIAEAAKRMVLDESGDFKAAEEAFTAGLLHDCGKLILAANFREKWSLSQQMSDEEGVPSVQAEEKVFGCNHADVGAYVLSMWGMPVQLQEVTAFHNSPQLMTIKSFNGLAAVHVANALSHRVHGDQESQKANQLDQELVNRLGIGHFLDDWQRLFEQELADGNDEENANENENVGGREPEEGRSQSATAGKTSFVVRKRASAKRPSGAALLRQWLLASVGTAAACIVVVGAIWWIGQVMHPSSGPSEAASEGSDALGIEDVQEALAVENSRVLAASAASPPVVSRQPAATSTSPDVPATLAERTDAKSVAPAVDTAAQKSPTPAPQFKLQAVFGSGSSGAAVINGELRRVGDVVNGATILAIGKSSVRVEFDGNERTIVR